jgi:hypothetical protein
MRNRHVPDGRGGPGRTVVTIGIAPLRANRPRADSVQGFAAIAPCLVTVRIGRFGYRRSHPVPAPAPPDGPGRMGLQCLSGGDDREGPGSCGRPGRPQEPTTIDPAAP